jgi:hypothetical protein
MAQAGNPGLDRLSIQEALSTAQKEVDELTLFIRNDPPVYRIFAKSLHNPLDPDSCLGTFAEIFPAQTPGLHQPSSPEATAVFEAIAAMLGYQGELHTPEITNDPEIDRRSIRPNLNFTIYTSGGIPAALMDAWISPVDRGDSLLSYNDQQWLPCVLRRIDLLENPQLVSYSVGLIRYGSQYFPEQPPQQVV